MQKIPNADAFDFLIFDENKKTITCQPGHRILEHNLVVPPGYTFIAGPGVHLDILNQYIAIYSYSPLQFIGTPNNPVKITTSTNKGMGLLVLNTPDTSILKYCHFDGLTSPSSIGWSVTGAVNFYEADVIMEHCSFSNNRCEDALNILRSYFELNNCFFTNIHADAF